MHYSGDEESKELNNIKPPETDAVYELRTPKLPQGVVPIFDDEKGAVIGYRHEPSTGFYRYYDLEGNAVGIGEEPLKTPLIDPLDLIFIVGGVWKAIGKGLFSGGITKLLPRAAAKTAITLSARTAAVSVLGALRATFRRLSVQSLKFTAVTSARMATRGRYVPIHILHLAIKYGNRVPDPQKVKGVFMYTTKMIRNGKQYTLEVVVRESDWTILHFLYK